MAKYISIHTGNKIDEAVGKVDGIESDVSTLSQAVTTLEGTVSQLDQDVTTLEGTVSQLDQDVTTLEGTVSQLEQDVSTLEGTVSQLDQDVTSHIGDSDIHHSIPEIKTNIGIDSVNGDPSHFLNEQGNFISLPLVQHSNTTGKNAEQSFQHIDNSVNTETTLTNNDKLAFYSNTLSKFVTITIPNFLIWIKAQLDSYFQLKNIVVENTSILTGDWVSDTTYSGYGYKAVITINGVTSSMLAEVTLGHTESISGNYAPVCITGTNSVTIYSKVNTGITIPTILIQK